MAPSRRPTASAPRQTAGWRASREEAPRPAIVARRRPAGTRPAFPIARLAPPRAKGGAADRVRGTSEGGSRLGTPSKLAGSGTPAKAGGGGTPSKPAANGRYLMVGPLAGSEPHGPGSRHGSRHASTEGANPVASPPNGRRQPHGAAGKGQQPGSQSGRPQQSSPPARRHVVPTTAIGTAGPISNGLSPQAVNAVAGHASTAASLPRAAQPAPPYSPVRPLASLATSPQTSAQKGLATGQASVPQAVAVDGTGWHPLGGQRPAEPARGPAVPPGVSLQAPHAAAMLAAVGAVPGLPSLFSPQQVDWSFSAPDRTGGSVAERTPGFWGSSGGGGAASSVESAPASSSSAFAALGGTRPPQPVGPSVRPLVGFSPVSARVSARPPGFGPLPQQPHLTASLPIPRASGTAGAGLQGGRAQHSLDSLQSSSFGSPASAEAAGAAAGARQALDGGVLQQQLRQLWADDRLPTAGTSAGTDLLRDGFRGGLWGSANVWS